MNRDPLREPLRGVVAFNPDLLSKEELIAGFIAREELLDRLLDDLRREPPDAAPQHHLILGQRGMGKTTLLHRLRYAIEDDSVLANVWLPLTFPEEQCKLMEDSGAHERMRPLYAALQAATLRDPTHLLRQPPEVRHVAEQILHDLALESL